MIARSGKRGRAYQPSKALRQKVAAAAGGGMSHEEIALALGMSRVTLSKHFEVELSTGAYQKRLEVMQAMQRAAKKGNVAAARAYLNVTPWVAPPPADKPAPAPEPKQPELGKKEQANRDAGTAQVGTEWADLLPDQAAPH